MSAGYSVTPLSKKLGIREGDTIAVMHAPAKYRELFETFPENVTITTNDQIKKNLIHYFVRDYSKLLEDMFILKNNILQNGCIWISWPKKSAKVQTDITEDMIRNIALQNGLVDVKVCAVDDVWSGLKLVIPVKNRK